MQMMTQNDTYYREAGGNAGRNARANRGRKWYQSIDIFNLSGGPFSSFHFKGTPSREEHKTVHSVFITIESASTG